MIKEPLFTDEQFSFSIPATTTEIGAAILNHLPNPNAASSAVNNGDLQSQWSKSHANSCSK